MVVIEKIPVTTYRTQVSCSCGGSLQIQQSGIAQPVVSYLSAKYVCTQCGEVYDLLFPNWPGYISHEDIKQ